jgi:pSer/pThr/pTyr-binding forkhead associated (FHA) protein
MPPGPRPELIFVTGPQTGRRVVLMRDVMLGGRSDLADISFQEEFVSREQLQFRRIPEGWIVERLARSNPMCINQKRYKPGRQILLASGDVIAVGAKTEMLFVDPMDDPNVVLAEYRRDHPEPEPTPVEPAVEETKTREPSFAPPPIPPSPEPKKKKTVITKNSKARKYLIAFVAYLAVLGVAAFFLSQMKEDKDEVAESTPPRLDADQISEVLRADLARSPNEVSAQRSLREARMYFRHRTSERRNRYRCLTAYRLYKAYRRPEQRTFLPEDERQYNQVVEELTGEVRDIYNRAWVAEQQGQWAKAKEQYELLTEYIPLNLADDDPAVRSVLLDNVMAHMRYVSKHRGKK